MLVFNILSDISQKLISANILMLKQNIKIDKSIIKIIDEMGREQKNQIKDEDKKQTDEKQQPT